MAGKAKNPVNLEFDIDGEVSAPVVKPKAKPKAKFIDPEDDRANWPTIRIDSEDGKPNYEFLAVHGTKKNGEPFSHELQVMREVEVPVPPSVVNMLRTAVSAHYTQRKDASTGRKMMVKQERSSVPWQLVKAGKYFR